MITIIPILFAGIDFCLCAVNQRKEVVGARFHGLTVGKCACVGCLKGARLKHIACSRGACFEAQAGERNAHQQHQHRQHHANQLVCGFCLHYNPPFFFRKFFISRKILHFNNTTFGDNCQRPFSRHFHQIFTATFAISNKC